MRSHNGEPNRVNVSFSPKIENIFQRKVQSNIFAGHPAHKGFPVVVKNGSLKHFCNVRCYHCHHPLLFDLCVEDSNQKQTLQEITNHLLLIYHLYLFSPKIITIVLKMLSYMLLYLILNYSYLYLQKNSRMSLTNHFFGNDFSNLRLSAFDSKEIEQDSKKCIDQLIAR